MRNQRLWWAFVSICISLVVVCYEPSFAQDLQLPTDYGIDIQLGMTSRPVMMGSSSELVGTQANQTGDDVFHGLIAAGFAQPYPWKLTVVNNGAVNAASTAGGQVYVYGGMLPLIGQNKGLWAAVLSHETAHTGRRHQVRMYLLQQYNQRMIQYYRLRAAAGDKSANWALIGFVAASKISMKKIARDQEHDADQQGMLLMARAGYHPDYVFALHHLLLMNTGERSKFAAFFSDHPRWETRDQRSDRVYAEALAEFHRMWADAAASPGGRPPLVAFFGELHATENKEGQTSDLTIPVFCHNAEGPVRLLISFQKDKHPVKANDTQFADKNGYLAVQENTSCLGRDDAAPIAVHIPASAVSDHDRSVKATAFIADADSVIAESKAFDVRFPKVKK